MYRFLAGVHRGDRQRQAVVACEPIRDAVAIGIHRDEATAEPGGVQVGILVHQVRHSRRLKCYPRRG